MASTDLIVKPRARAAQLESLRRAKMARSSHAYVRGSTVHFYEWLATRSGRSLPEGPPVWICGDCHLGNLGPLADAEGNVEVQIRDLDQTVIGNPTHDLVRLGLSLASACRSSDLPGITTALVLERMVSGYVDGLNGGKRLDKNRNRPDIVQQLLRTAGQRKWRHLAKERIEDVKPRIPLGARFWTLSQAEKRGLGDLFAAKSAAKHFSSLIGKETSDIELLDAAYWVKGCSSLGRLRYAVLARIGENNGLSLFDVKEGVTAAAPRAARASMPKDNAVRVVTGARALSPNLGDRMLAAHLLRRSVIIRELMPQDLKIEADRLTRDEAVLVAEYLASVIGIAHGRQLNAQDRKSWIRELSRKRSKSLDAPSWLWSNVVELIVAHERAYLEHCRVQTI